MDKIYEVDIYLFGQSRTVIFRAGESIEELRQDQSLVFNYLLNAIGNEMIIQDRIEEV